MILEVLKYILIVLGIIIVGAFIIYALASLMLAIVDPHAKDNKNANTQPAQPVQNQQIVYEQPKLLAEPEKEEENIEQSDVKDVDLDKAREEELALSQGSSVTALNEEEDNFIKEKQKAIEERINAKQAKEEEKAQDDEINLDDIFVDSDEEEKEEPAKEEDDDEDIEALINKILAGNDEEEETEAEEPAEEVAEEQPAEETPVATEEQPEEKTEEVAEETPVEEVVEDKNNEQEDRIKALEEELARQKEEYENKLKETQDAKEQEINEQIEQLKQELAEKDKQLAEVDKPAGALTLEEYEERLRVLNERLAVNEKEFRAVKKEYLPLAKIKKSYEKDKVKLRRKEALVAKQKVVLYGVNNYVDIDEEKAKKLSEDLDLLDGLRLSVQHCEEVLKQNEERYPILENSYNILLATNENLKSDIAECTAKIAELKADQE
ncbi:MAG: hypothetical protein SOV27_00910 [Eubacteriales bacterium]|nr:hypothetical protein [Eubacteriales bacterium]